MTAADVIYMELRRRGDEKRDDTPRAEPGSLIDVLARMWQHREFHGGSFGMANLGGGGQTEVLPTNSVEADYSGEWNI